MLHDYDTIVAFSHLRWDFVYQRPQQLLSRMAARRRVIFIEEEEYIEGVQPHWYVNSPEENVLVFRLRTPIPGGSFSDEQVALFGPMLRDLAGELGLRPGRYVTWMQTPMAVNLARGLAQSIPPMLVVYDCMDELSAFRGAPPSLLEREESLLRWANIVFTGGPSLYGSKQNKHPNVHCFPSSVDTAHFRKALGVDDPEDQAALPHPRFGFYGVIDERIDYELLDAVSRSRPDWQLVMVGPFAKVDPASLPQHPNLHYLGQRSYNQLPAYLGGWDVAIMPFARNEATRFISPTKTLEYMAGEKLIVSTPITDVAEPYGHIVYLGDTPETFIAACEQALNASKQERLARLRAMRGVLARTSWDATVQGMEQAIAQALPSGVRAVTRSWGQGADAAGAAL
jgi:UDP-galactopyranose mutase